MRVFFKDIAAYYINTNMSHCIIQSTYKDRSKTFQHSFIIDGTIASILLDISQISKQVPQHNTSITNTR